MKKWTLSREACIKWYNQQQSEWFMNILVVVYGSLANAKFMEKGKASVYNSLNVFRAHAQAPFVEIGPIFRTIGRETRTEFVNLDILLNKEYRQNRPKYDFLYLKHASKSGLLGSRDRYVPINFEDIKKQLQTPNSEIEQSFTVGRVKAFIEKSDRPSSAYRVPQPAQIIPLM